MRTFLCVLARRFLSREKKLNLWEGKDGNERLPLAVHVTGFAIARDVQQQTWGERISSRCGRKGWGCGSELFRKAAGVDSTCDCHGTLEVTHCEQGVNVGDVWCTSPLKHYRGFLLLTGGNKKLLETYIMGFFTSMMQRKEYSEATWDVRWFICKEMNVLK